MSETLNPKLETLNKPKTQNPKIYNLGNRTLDFAKRAFIYVNDLPKTIPNVEIGKQLSRSSSSIGANYIEAEEALSRKDFILRIKICRKEAKETRYWLSLSETKDSKLTEKVNLIQEATELMKIFGSIVQKAK